LAQNHEGIYEMDEILQSDTLSKDAGIVTYTVTSTEISMTYSDGVTATMPNISHDYNLQTDVVTGLRPKFPPTEPLNR
jgi:hypothetical protein